MPPAAVGADASSSKRGLIILISRRELFFATLERKEEPITRADPDPKVGADPPEPKAGRLPEPKSRAADLPPKMDVAARAGAGAGVLLEAGSEDPNEKAFFGAAADRGGHFADVVGTEPLINPEEGGSDKGVQIYGRGATTA